MKKKIKGYFEFTPGEMRGLIIFLFLIATIMIAPYVWEKFNYQPIKITVENLEPQIKEIERFKDKNHFNDDDNDETSGLAKPKAQLFNFNPNNLSLQNWMKLGLSEKQANSIKSYEAKGGKFRSKADVKKMFVISAKKFEELEPYIQITETASPNVSDYPSPNSNYPKKARENIMVEINSADSITLTTISGIGPSFASRILKYKNRLGGFNHINQLKEVYGIDSLKFEQIKNQVRVDNANIVLIKINDCTFEQLKTFPYLAYKQSNAIIAYRKQHGDYKNQSDLSKIAILNAETIQKIIPYIKF